MFMLAFQKGNSASLSLTAWVGSHLPKALQLPATARISSGFTIGAATLSLSDSGRALSGWSGHCLIMIPSANAEE